MKKGREKGENVKENGIKGYEKSRRMKEKDKWEVKG
jgi:hypothetical protein